jgi:hypothetical protein
MWDINNLEGITCLLKFAEEYATRRGHILFPS